MVLFSELRNTALQFLCRYRGLGEFVICNFILLFPPPFRNSLADHRTRDSSTINVFIEPRVGNLLTFEDRKHFGILSESRIKAI